MSQASLRPSRESTPDGTPSRSDQTATASRESLGAAIAALRAIDPAAPEAGRAAALAALAEAVRQQDAFLHAAAHDLRNPLAVIHGQTQLLRRRARRIGTPAFDPDRFDEGLAGIEAAVARTAELIDRLLDAGWETDGRGRGS